MRHGSGYHHWIIKTVAFGEEICESLLCDKVRATSLTILTLTILSESPFCIITSKGLILRFVFRDGLSVICVDFIIVLAFGFLTNLKWLWGILEPTISGEFVMIFGNYLGQQDTAVMHHFLSESEILRLRYSLISLRPGPVCR